VLFNSVAFLILLLPVSLLVFYFLGRFKMKAAKFWLAAVSLFFYGISDQKFLPLLVGSIIFNYICGRLIQTYQDRLEVSSRVLAFGILGNLALLFNFKYFIEMMKGLCLMLDYHGVYWGYRALPLGISFFTLTQIGFLIDRKEGKAEENGFLDYVLFAVFFPYLSAGPIVHHREITPQFTKKETYFFNWNNIGVGLTIFIIGLAKKVLIADQLMPVANDVFNNPGDKHALEAWVGVMTYSLQLYFDFSGYSEMSLGITRLFNVRLPANFDSPYKSESIIEFWQRWHISLTRYLNLYLYNPVSLWIIRKRAAKGLASLKTEEKTLKGFLITLAVPTFYTMILAGIWHGAGFQFLIFGLLHGFYLCANHFWRLFGSKAQEGISFFLPAWLDKAWKIGLTYLAVLTTLIFFRSSDANSAWSLLGSMAGIGTKKSPGGPPGILESVSAYFNFDIPSWHHASATITLVFFLIFVWIMPNVLQLFEKEGASLTKVKAASPFISYRWSPNLFWSFLAVFLFLMSVFFLGGTTEFLYFNF
jgi:alginate O-acetyltransferase complex protein AlgI